MMRIGLIGFDFNNPNKGCEALSYSFVNMLTELANEDLEIHVFSYADLGDFPKIYPQFKFVWHRLKMKNPIYWIKLKNEFDKCDCVFDITYGDGFSDIYGKIWNANTDMAKQIANMSKAPFILLPQTYGPYENKFLRAWAVHIVKGSTLAFSRDKQSADEMSSLGCDKIIATTDLAFALPYNKDLYSIDNSKFNIGFNVSSLLWECGHNIKLKTDYKEYCRKIISTYRSEGNIVIHLIPHVIDFNNAETLENDLRVCMLLHEEFPFTILSPNFKTPVEAKSYIGNMDVFIGARMHATIGAMSSGVPVIPFSYSKKFEGLFGNIEYPYVISGTKIDTDVAIKLTQKYMNNLEQLEKDRAKAMYNINDKLSEIRSKINEILMAEQHLIE